MPSTPDDVADRARAQAEEIAQRLPARGHAQPWTEPGEDSGSHVVRLPQTAVEVTAALLEHSATLDSTPPAVAEDLSQSAVDLRTHLHPPSA